MALITYHSPPLTKTLDTIPKMFRTLRRAWTCIYPQFASEIPIPRTQNIMDAAAHLTAHYKASTLLIFLTAHDEDHAKILGLDLGCLDKDVKGFLTVEKQR